MGSFFSLSYVVNAPLQVILAEPADPLCVFRIVGTDKLTVGFQIGLDRAKRAPSKNQPKSKMRNFHCDNKKSSALMVGVVAVVAVVPYSTVQVSQYISPVVVLVTAKAS